MIEVIGASFGRTGTHSLASALEILGLGPCYHMHELQRNPDHTSTWMDALDGKKIDWKAFLKPYKSTVEWPSVYFLSEILPIFPKAKVVITKRNPEDWFESANATIFEGLELSAFNPNHTRRKQGALGRRLILEEVFSNRHREKDYAIEIYQKHIELVVEMVPSEQLLQFHIAEGWEPLCRFLGVEALDIDFPWVHERTAFMSEEPEWAKKIKREREATSKD